MFRNRVRLLQYIVVPIAHDTKACARQNGITNLVGAGIQVLTAIDLNDDMSLKTDKIQDVIFEGHLPAEFETDEAPMP